MAINNTILKIKNYTYQSEAKSNFIHIKV